MTRFNLDAVAAEEARERYEFEAGGRVFSLPHVSDLTIGEQHALDAGRYVQTMPRVVEFAPDDDPGDDERSAEEALLSALFKKKPAQVAPLIAAWLSHAGLKPGESPASST